MNEFLLSRLIVLVQSGKLAIERVPADYISAVRAEIESNSQE